MARHGEHAVPFRQTDPRPEHATGGRAIHQEAIDLLCPGGVRFIRSCGVHPCHPGILGQTRVSTIRSWRGRQAPNICNVSIGYYAFLKSTMSPSESTTCLYSRRFPIPGRRGGDRFGGTASATIRPVRHPCAPFDRRLVQGCWWHNRSQPPRCANCGPPRSPAAALRLPGRPARRPRRECGCRSRCWGRARRREAAELLGVRRHEALAGDEPNAQGGN